LRLQLNVHVCTANKTNTIRRKWPSSTLHKYNYGHIHFKKHTKTCADLHTG